METKTEEMTVLSVVVVVVFKLKIGSVRIEEPEISHAASIYGSRFRTSFNLQYSGNRKDLEGKTLDQYHQLRGRGGD